jgi:hypothetical protein
VTVISPNTDSWIKDVMELYASVAGGLGSE